MKKKPYSKPSLKKYGTVRELTKAMSVGERIDNGAGPRNMKNCITPAPEIEEHRHLLMDDVSQGRFKEMIHRHVRPGDVVLDLGTGSGVHAFFACQAGARKVYAVDSESIIEVARETAEANGFAAQIEFVMSEAEGLELPEKVDVIITNIGFLNTLTILPDVARRLLKPGGRLIPESVDVQFTLVDAPKEFESRVRFWEGKRYGLDFGSFRRMATNHPLYTEYKPEQLLAEAKSLGPVDYLNFSDEHLEAEIRLMPKTDGIAHGLGGWYRFWVGDDLLMSTEPPLRLDREIWSEIFLPFDQPLSIKSGEELVFRVGMYARGGLNGPFWRWQAWRGEDKIVDQCSFYATPLSSEILAKITEH